MIHDAQKHGAKLALFGRKINNAENQLAFIEFLRLIVDGVIGPEEAVRAYHAVLGRLSLTPHRPLDVDLQLTSGTQSYGGTPRKPATASGASATPPAATNAGPVNLAKMSSAERLAYHRERINRLFGNP
ncbi:MAG: hypothetical protein U0992_09640 [Planctomycetaceae bacterium]